jgi:ornithine carbamoyltransferase
MHHFLNLFDIPADTLKQLLADAARLKTSRRRGIPSASLAGKVIGLVFEKPSLRTRVSFEAAIAQLGGSSLFLPGNEVGLGWRESLPDFARTMSRYVDAIVLRVFRQETVDTIAQWAAVPVINGLSDRDHPCQALADLQTIEEQFGTVAGKTVAFIGDGNNVAMSLAVGVAKLGGQFLLACPAGYEFDAEFQKRFRAELPGIAFPVSINDPQTAVRSADVIYTDVWTSMGQEAQRDQRLQHFEGFQVNADLIALAPSHAKVLHCLPAHRGEEITDEVMESPQSLVFDQAENRLHAQKAILEWVLSR